MLHRSGSVAGRYAEDHDILFFDLYDCRVGVSCHHSHIYNKWADNVPYSYALIAWLADMLKKEPEARSILVAVAVTLVCKYLI